MRRGRPSFQVKLMITSNDDNRFSTLRTFENMMDASMAVRLMDRGIRIAYNLGRESMRKDQMERLLLQVRKTRSYPIDTFQNFPEGVQRVVQKL